MTLIDEFTRECLAIRVARRINSFGVIETMAERDGKRAIGMKTKKPRGEPRGFFLKDRRRGD
jgi:hypothetical protein